MRRMQAAAAKQALAEASQAAMRAQIPVLLAEVQAAKRTLALPVARRVHAEGDELLSLEQVAALLGSDAFVVDGCRRNVQCGETRLTYETRPVLFSLVRALAQAWPQEVVRDELIRVGFGMRRSNDSLRARLRVAVGRLRKQLQGLAELRATASGFMLLPTARDVLVLAPPLDDDASRLLALVSDGEAWSTSSLALAFGASQRSIQRALSALELAGKVTSTGRGKSRRWLAPPIHPFATHMLLPVLSPTP